MSALSTDDFDIQSAFIPIGAQPLYDAYENNGNL